MRLLIAFAFFIMTNTLLTAQNSGPEDSNKSRNESSCTTNKPEAKDTDTGQTEKHPSRQEIESQKIAFFTQELNLTPQEAEKFWPIYNASWHARGRARKATMHSLEDLNEALEANPPVSDIRIKELSDTYIESFKKEGELFASYFNDFKKVLPLRKAVKVFSAEEKFRIILIKQLRGK